MKRIIVEGMDGSGKTTLLNSLQEGFGVPPLWRVPGYKKSNGDTGGIPFAKWLRQRLMEMYPGVPIHDRFFYSELVYGPVINHRIDVTPMERDQILSELRSTAFLIYCRVPYSTILTNISQEEQMDGVHVHSQELYDMYEGIMTEEIGHYFPDRWAIWDYTRESSDYLGLYEMLEHYIGL